MRVNDFSWGKGQRERRQQLTTKNLQLGVTSVCLLCFKYVIWSNSFIHEIVMHFFSFSAERLASTKRTVENLLNKKIISLWSTTLKFALILSNFYLFFKLFLLFSHSSFLNFFPVSIIITVTYYFQFWVLIHSVQTFSLVSFVEN